MTLFEHRLPVAPGEGEHEAGVADEGGRQLACPEAVRRPTQLGERQGGGRVHGADHGGAGTGAAQADGSGCRTEPGVEVSESEALGER
ncbi:hypothetical protein QOZ88_14500 [Blastococcus sp. BMG 814]|uniref:Uncharacterized protein n=1 Tax=Blastococcus carthaginiensis TaxID=3050034 RepID=A0ABT9IE54_9ACTN|nr:hypothetical protein [Blastococcus carthaginiensis]MDP5183847.1 hypothetical protein [Blastococcus carthaginiensis]